MNAISMFGSHQGYAYHSENISISAYVRPKAHRVLNPLATTEWLLPVV